MNWMGGVVLMSGLTCVVACFVKRTERTSGKVPMVRHILRSIFVIHGLCIGLFLIFSYYVNVAFFATMAVVLHFNAINLSLVDKLSYCSIMSPQQYMDMHTVDVEYDQKFGEFKEEVHVHFDTFFVHLMLLDVFTQMLVILSVTCGVSGVYIIALFAGISAPLVLLGLWNVHANNLYAGYGPTVTNDIRYLCINCTLFTAIVLPTFATFSDNPAPLVFLSDIAILASVAVYNFKNIL